MSKRKKIWVSVLLVCTLLVGIYGIAKAEYYGGKWPKTNILYYLNPSIPSEYFTYIADGVLSWNACNDIFVQRTTGSTYDVFVDMDYFGLTGWHGLTYLSPDRYSTYTYGSISLNLSYGMTSQYFWKSCTAHETGHTLGLDHTLEVDVNNKSIMVADYHKFYEEWRLYGPTERDITNIDNWY